MRTKFKLLSLSASLLVCGLGMSSSANAASAYAFASNEIRNGILTVTGGVATPGTSSSQTSTSGTPLPVTRAGDSQFGPSAPPPNALPATQGAPVRLDETIGGSPGTTGATGYTQFGQTGTSYSWSDAIILTEQTGPSTSVSARNAAEGYLVSTGNATSQASNGSTNSVFFAVDLGAPGTMNFAFEAQPYMVFDLSADAGTPGSRAAANLDFNISIQRVSDSVEVFSWSPDGVINATGGSVVGVENFDPENLNGTIGTTIPGVNGNFSPSNAFSFFSATTGLLAAGAYNFNLNMNESQVVQLRVPEPGSLALMGLSLAGLAFTKRRKQA